MSVQRAEVHPTAAEVLDKHAAHTAYERGRRDGRRAERRERKRHPFGMTLLFVLAAVGLAVVALAAVNGSFRRAGDVVDANLVVAAERAGPAVRQAAADAGRSLKDPTPAAAPPAQSTR